MVEGLLIIGEVMSCMGVDIVSLQVIPIYKPISLLMDILISVIFKALPIEVLPKCSVGEVA